MSPAISIPAVNDVSKTMKIAMIGLRDTRNFVVVGGPWVNIVMWNQC